MKRWKNGLRILVLGIIGIIGLFGASWATNIFGWRAWRLQEVQAFIGAELPPGASDVHFATQNAKTRIVWLRFEAQSEGDVSTFLEALGITEPLQPNFTPFPAANPQETGISWWNPQSATDFSGVYANGGTKVTEVLVSGNVVYLRAYAIGAK